MFLSVHQYTLIGANRIQGSKSIRISAMRSRIVVEMPVPDASTTNSASFRPLFASSRYH